MIAGFLTEKTHAEQAMNGFRIHGNAQIFDDFSLVFFRGKSLFQAIYRVHNGFRKPCRRFPCRGDKFNAQAVLVKLLQGQ